MIDLQFDYRELEAYAKGLGASVNQIPFALATALNKSADATRTHLIKTTWPTHINQRNTSFIGASLTTRGARASKQMLAVEIYDRLNRGNLQKQAKGGTRTARGGNLAIPSASTPRGSKGVPSRLRPKNLKNAFKVRGLLFTRDSKNRVRLAYALKPTTKIPKRVPFYEDFARVMRRELSKNIPLAVARAMATRRR